MLAPPDNAASWSAVVAAVAIVIAAVCLLRHVPASARAAATQAVGTVAPAVLALGGLVLVLELEPPLWAAVLAAALATAIAGGAAWWSRDHTLAASLGSGATAYLAVVTLYAALAADLLTALTATALFLALAAAAALRERVGAVLSAAISAGAGSARRWLGAHRVGDCHGGRHRGPRPRPGGVRRAGRPGRRAVDPSYRHAGDRSRAQRSSLADRRHLYSADDRTTAMALTIVGTAICLVAVTTRDRAPAGLGRSGRAGVRQVHPGRRGRAGSRALHAARRRRCSWPSAPGGCAATPRPAASRCSAAG